MSDVLSPSDSWHFKALISRGPKNFLSPIPILKDEVLAVILSKAFKLIKTFLFFSESKSVVVLSSVDFEILYSFLSSSSFSSSKVGDNSSKFIKGMDWIFSSEKRNVVFKNKKKEQTKS